MPPHRPPTSPAPADLLLSPPALASLALLLLNDHVLKAAYGSWLTGKLSDFAGLLAFALFCRAMLPRRRAVACAAAGAAFAFWKLPLSGPLVDALNALGAGVGRVVDATDLLALAVLPLAYAYAPRPRVRVPLRRMLSSGVAAACVLAFAATSRMPAPPLRLGGEYAFPVPPDTLLMRMYDLRLDVENRGVPEAMPESGSHSMEIAVAPRGQEHRAIGFRVEVREAADGGSVLRLGNAERRFDHRDVTEDQAMRIFERRVLEPLRRNAPLDSLPPSRRGGPQEGFYRPVLWSPDALFASRAEVDVSLAEPAYVAVVEVTPDDAWHVVYPVDPRAEVRLPPGRHTLSTTCAARPAAAPRVEPGQAVGPCDVARRVAAADVRRWSRWHEHRCGGHRPANALSAGRLVLIAADAPLRRAELQEAVADLCRTPAAEPYANRPLGLALRKVGVRAWAASEMVLRR
ncbi:MAG TPA: hypothetical protein VFQ45_16135 [Longimicrobium sp.]|nr:hypothetical protein [Longimicrobium sp.]